MGASFILRSMAASEATTEVRGLSEAEAAQRLRGLGPVEHETSRSVRSIVRANVLTLFNAIILVFFILILSQGLWADALFGVIAIVNSAIGIRQEMKAKETLDNLALLVAPRAEVIRDGRGDRAPRRGDRPRRRRSGSSPAISSSPTATSSTRAG